MISYYFHVNAENNDLKTLCVNMEQKIFYMNIWFAHTKHTYIVSSKNLEHFIEFPYILEYNSMRKNYIF